MASHFLCSIFETHIKDENGVRIPIVIKDENFILSNIQARLKKRENCLIIANNPNDFEYSDIRKEGFKNTFAITGIPFENYETLDWRNFKEAEKLISNADFVFICGGSILLANTFYKKIKLGKHLKKSSAVVVGSSAGSMWQTRNIFNFPETEDEIGLPLWVKGFGFCDDVFIPHFDGEKLKYQLEEISLDVVQKWILPASRRCKILGFPDGSYILIENGNKTIFGTYYEIEDGKVKTIRQ